MKRNNYFYKEKKARQIIKEEYRDNTTEIPYTSTKTFLSVVVDDRYCPQPMRKAMEFISRLYSIDTGCWGCKENDKPDGRDLYNLDKCSGFTIRFNESYVRSEWDNLKEFFYTEISDGVSIDSFYKFVKKNVTTTKSRRFKNEDGEWEVEYYDEVNTYWDCVRLFPLNWLKYDYKTVTQERIYKDRISFWERGRTRRITLQNKLGKYYNKLERPNRHRWEAEDWFHNGLGKREQNKQSTNTWLNREAQDEHDWWTGYDEYHNETTEMIWDYMEDEYKNWKAENNRESNIVFNTTKGKKIYYWTVNERVFKLKKTLSVPMNEYNEIDYKALKELVYETEVFGDNFSVWYGVDGQYYTFHSSVA